MNISPEIITLVPAIPAFFLLLYVVLPAREGIYYGVSRVFAWIFGLILIFLGVLPFYPGLEFYLARGEIQIWKDFYLRPGLYLDAKNAPLIALAGIVVLLSSLWLRDTYKTAGKSFHIASGLMLLGITGVFLSDSLILFYVFWEISLIGAYFWIGFFGRSPDTTRDQGPSGILTRFFLFTLVGSVAMLLSIAAICASSGSDVSMSFVPGVVQNMSGDLQFAVFAGFFLAFAIKTPLLLFHGWLRETYSAAPPLARVYLSALMSKMGTYGFFIIIANAFPMVLETVGMYLLILAAAGIVYGAFICLSRDRMLDVYIYSSLVHLNLIAVGLFSISGSDEGSSAMSAAVFQMFNHGLIVAALFSLEARTPDFSIAGSSGRPARIGAFTLLAILASVSLPGMSSFVGEVLILYSTFVGSPWLAFAAISGSILAGAAIVRIFHRTFFSRAAGEIKAASADLSVFESVAGLTLAVVWIGLGFFPSYFLDSIDKAIYVFRMLP